MKCKQHPNERGPGVCASCLSDRLFALVAAQSGLSGDLLRHRQRSAAADHLAPAPPPAVVFPRSVSPYVSRRRSVGSDGPDPFRHGLFFSTPHIGPTFDASGGGDPPRRSSGGRFSVLSILFRHRRSGEAAEADRGDSRSFGSPGSGSSWFSALIPGRWKKEVKPFRKEKAAAAAVVAGRGMSPAVEDDAEDYSVSSSGYSTESSSAAAPGWRQPAATPMRRFQATHRYRRRHHHHNGGSVSGFAFCRSPMMRPGPGGGRGGPPPPPQQPEAAIFGEPRASTHRHVPASLRPNRSRKLADFGRIR